MATKKTAAKTAAKTKTAAKRAAAKPAAKQAAKAQAKPAVRQAAPKPAQKTAAPMPKPAAKAPHLRVVDSSKPLPPAAAVQQAAVAAPVAQAPKKLDYKPGDFVVYPAHGVGRILRIESQEIAGLALELFVIAFEKDKMTLRVPLGKAKAVGMRKLSSPETVQNALNTLKGRARVKRTMWSRRAQEYEAKINSGDLISIAEVVRDLHRPTGQPEQSYSERQLYEAALDRMARELAAVERIDEKAALERLEGALRRAA